MSEAPCAMHCIDILPSANVIRRKDMDRDTAIILSLVFLLMSDGGDELLIMALLYILS